MKAPLNFLSPWASVSLFSGLLVMLIACGRSPESSARLELDEMDQRQPVPLLPMMASHQKENMRDHLLVVEEITQALAIRDFAAVEKAASRFAYSSKQARMCSRMGSGAEGFAEAGIEFHHTADSIIEAAQEKDVDQVLTALGTTLARCTSCHNSYRQKLVTQREWRELTKETVPLLHDDSH